MIFIGFGFRYKWSVQVPYNVLNEILSEIAVVDKDKISVFLQPQTYKY